MSFKLERVIKRLEKNPPLLLVIVFFLVIFSGGTLLSMPFVSQSGEATPFIDALFTSTSAVCVTGLVTVNTAAHWNTLGHIIIISLIQFGGLGFMTVAGAVAMALKKRITLQDRLVIQEETNSSSLSGLVKLIQYILKATFLIEGIGALFLAMRFIPEFGMKRGLWYSVFHAISAYCNAGFDILGEYSLAPYVGDIIITLTISSLIVLGGIGFNVYKEVLSKKSFKRLNLHTKLVLMLTALLLLGGTVVVFLLERNNPATIGADAVSTQLLASYFQSATTRTAGYFSMDQVGMHDATAVLSIILMLIGGSPAGTAGGIKTTTFGLLILSMVSVVRGSEYVHAFARRIEDNLVKRASAITIISLGWVMVISFILTVTEPQFTYLNLLFETVSGFATVGLTRGVTPGLSDIGKLLIISTMYLGKVGPLTLFYAFTKREKNKSYKEAVGNVLIG